MNNFLANGLLRLSGYATGVRPERWLPRMESMQWWSADQIIEWQQRELHRLLNHAQSVPYYSQRLPVFSHAVGRDISDTLSQLPLLTKDQVRENFEALQAPKQAGLPPLHVSTSGSTGKPLNINIDRECFGRYFAAKFRALRWHGVNFADRQVRVWGVAINKRKRLYWDLRDLLQNRMRLVSFDLSDTTLDSFFVDCQKFQPCYINGYTSAIASVASYFERSGKDATSFGAKVILPTAEILYDWQRELMERVFGCPVMNEYGGCEIAAIAYECPAGQFHLTHENVYVEALDEDGQPVPDGEPGLLTTTSFAARGMPMIRYQNGDVVVFRPSARCECGRHQGLKAMERIVGRAADVVLRADGQTTHWTTLYYAIKDALEPGMILEHQARQKALDLMEIQVVKGPRYDEKAMNKLLSRLNELLGQEVQFKLVFVENIDREKSGKHRYFVSDLDGQKLRSHGAV